MNSILNGFFEYVNNIRYINPGVEIYTLSIDMHHRNYHPALMADPNGIIEQNIEPVKLSDFKNRYKVLIEKYEKECRNSNISLIDLTDNLCW